MQIIKLNTAAPAPISTLRRLKVGEKFAFSIKTGKRRRLRKFRFVSLVTNAVFTETWETTTIFALTLSKGGVTFTLTGTDAVPTGDLLDR